MVSQLTRNRLENIVQGLQAVADLAFQSDRWAPGRGNFWDSYGEEMCCLFDDMRASEVADLSDEELGYDREQANTFRELIGRLYAHSKTLAPIRDIQFSDLKTDSEWLALAELAKEFLLSIGKPPLVKD